MRGQTEIRRVSQGVMIFFGLLSFGLNIYPVKYLQALVVFSTSTIAATLLVPAVMAAYWRAGHGAGSDCGDVRRLGHDAVAVRRRLGLWRFRDMTKGSARTRHFARYYLLGLEPIVWGLVGVRRGRGDRQPGHATPRRALGLMAVRPAGRPTGDGLAWGGAGHP